MNLTDPAAALVAFSLMTWLLAISYFLGYNANKLNSLKAAHEKSETKIDAVIGKIFERIDALAAAVPHQCVQVQALAGLQTQIGVNTNRLTQLEAWRHDQSKG